VEITLSNEQEAIIEVASEELFKATDPLSQVVEALVGMEGVANIVVASSAHDDLTTLPITVDALRELVNAKFDVAFQRVSLTQEQQRMLAESSTMIEFDRCTFENNGKQFVGFARHASSLLQVAFKERLLSDKDTIGSIESLTAVVKAGTLGKLRIKGGPMGLMLRKREEVSFKELVDATRESGCDFEFDKVQHETLGSKGLQNYVLGLGSGDNLSARAPMAMNNEQPSASANVSEGGEAGNSDLPASDGPES
jgi:hypothetical protein